MIQEHVLGEIQDVREDGVAVITAGIPDLDRARLPCPAGPLPLDQFAKSNHI